MGGADPDHTPFATGVIPSRNISFPDAREPISHGNIGTGRCPVLSPAQVTAVLVARLVDSAYSKWE